MMQIYKKTRQLVYQRHNIFIKWVPKHSRVERNKKADKITKETAKNEKIRTAK